MLSLIFPVHPKMIKK